MSGKDLKVVLIGDINIDLTLERIDKSFCFDKNMGREIKLEKALLEVGGSGFNFAKIASAISMDVKFIGKIGNDVFGDYIKDYLKSNRIKNYLIIDEKINTGITVLFPIEEDRVYFTYPGSNRELNIDDINLDEIKKYTHLHYSSYYLLENMQSYIIDIFKYLKSESHITISFDPGSDPEGRWQSEKILSALQYVDIFIPNEKEALGIAKKKNVEDSLDFLSKICNLVVIKLGAKGSIAKTRDHNIGEFVYIPSFKVEFKDSSCCGDSFDAGFVYSYLNGKSLEESLKFANACGALQASKLGNYSFESLKEVKDFIEGRELSSLTFT